MANPFNVPKFKIAPFASNALTCVVQRRTDYLYMLKVEGPILTRCHTFLSDTVFNAFVYKPLDHREERMDGAHAVNLLIEILKTDRCEELMLLDNYSTYRDRISSMQTQFETM